MFIADWNTFDKYASFLFPYLEEVEKRLKKHSYNRLKRNIGYIAEAMLGFWIEYAKVRTKYVPTVDLSFSPYNRGLRGKVRNIKRDLGLEILYMPKRQKIYYYGAAVQALKNQGIVISDK